MPESSLAAQSDILIDMLKLEDRVAVVTGGSRGIGRAVVECFARLGAHVVVNYVRDDQAAKQTVSEAETHGVGALAVQADVSLKGDAQRLIDAAARKFERVDFLVCNAGIWEGVRDIPRLGGLAYFYLKARLEQWGQGYHSTPGSPMPPTCRSWCATAK